MVYDMSITKIKTNVYLDCYVSWWNRGLNHRLFPIGKWNWDAEYRTFYIMHIKFDKNIEWFTL